MNARNARKRQKRGLPWFRDFDSCWYATVKGVRHKLAKGEENKKEALKEWHRLNLLAGAEQSKEANPCWVIFEHYLEHVQRHHTSCYSRYRETFQSFKDHLGDWRVDQLTVRQVHAWLDAHPSWGDSTRSLAVAVICSALNWAAKPEQGLLDKNPIRGMKRPSIRSRGAEAVIDPDDFRQLYETVNDPMKEVLLFLRQTGTRPVNLTRITAKNIDWENRCVRLTVHKTAGKTGRPLVIPLTQTALDLLARLAKRHPEGPLFRTIMGNPFTSLGIGRAIRHACKKLKLKGKVIPYGFRHTVATELLGKDMAPAKVAFLLGHKDTNMLHHHYAHLERDTQAIAEEIDRVLNGDAAGPKTEPS